MARILVDADACPVVAGVEEMAEKYDLPCKLFCDTNHVLKSSYSQVEVVGAGADAVDFALISQLNEGDVVVTQDYGVAAMALGKGAFGIHQSGIRYTQDNMDQLLLERHLSKKARRASSRHHGKGPHKRTAEDDERFEREFRRLLDSIMEK